MGTLLSIVPLLALSFSVLKAFGVHNQIQPMLLKFLEPLGKEGEEIAANIIAFIQNMNVGVLGALGLALLLYTAISLMQKIEESLNYIWHIHRHRPLADRFSRYLSVLMVGPILVFAALGITATVMNVETVRGVLAIEMFGQLVQTISRLMPYLLVIAAFTFIYMFIPNARVRLLPALIGGIAGGAAWQTAGWGFATFVASSNQYAAIYSSLAILILFMIWLYLSWLILLFGASVAFYAQHPEYLYAGAGEPRLSNRMRERLGLATMTLVAGRFVAGERMPSLNEFIGLLRMPRYVLQAVLDAPQQSHEIEGRIQIGFGSHTTSVLFSCYSNYQPAPNAVFSAAVQHAYLSRGLSQDVWSGAHGARSRQPGRARRSGPGGRAHGRLRGGVQGARAVAVRPLQPHPCRAAVHDERGRRPSRAGDPRRGARGGRPAYRVICA